MLFRGCPLEGVLRGGGCGEYSIAPSSRITILRAVIIRFAQHFESAGS